MSKRTAFAALLSGFVFLVAAVRGNAQEVDAAIVVGTVVDTGRAVIASATVIRLTPPGHRFRRAGSYKRPRRILARLPCVSENMKSVSRHPALERFNQKGVVLNIGDVRQVDATLEVGELSQTVTVESAAPLLQTQDSTVGTVITNQEITELPLNGRNYQQLALLSAGTVLSAGQ